MLPEEWRILQKVVLYRKHGNTICMLTGVFALVSSVLYEDRLFLVWSLGEPGIALKMKL